MPQRRDRAIPSDQYCDGQLVQISFVPFLLPGPIDVAGLERAAHIVAKDTGASQASHTPIEHEIIGHDHVKLCTEVGLATIHLYLLADGLGVVRVDWPQDSINHDARRILAERRTRHREILEATSATGAKVRALAKRCRDSVQCRQLFPISRPEHSLPFDYVFSLYELHCKLDRNDELVLATEAALLRPSALGLSDTLWVPDSPEGTFPTAARAEASHPNVETCAHIRCRMSWASVVVSGVIGLETRDLYSALEIRAQALWLLSHRICQIPPDLGSHNLLQLELLSMIFERTVRHLLILDDPTANERILGLYDGIVTTSGLKAKIDNARQNISAIRHVSTARDTSRKARSEAITQVLLFAIASLQLLPSVVSTPLRGSARYAVISVCVIAVALFLFVRLRTKGR